MTARKVKWACPKCQATPNKHGKGGADKCADPDTHGTCMGFICECDSNEEHGDTPENPCPNAVCYHCGWFGEFPVPSFDSSKLKGWAKKAYEAGWRPPVGWKP